MNIDLLKRLRTRFLRMRHPEHFDMEPIAVKTACGSAMCIAGHALHVAGYKMRLKDDYVDDGETWSGRNDFDFVAPSGERVTDPLIAAAKELDMQPTFAMDGKSGAYDLFHDYSLKTPKDAAARIQELIESASDDKGRRL